MPDLEISDEQAAFLDSLRNALAEEVVGPYGNVRRQDALQYLIDHYGEPDELLAEGSPSSMPDPAEAANGAAGEESASGADDDAAADDGDAEAEAGGGDDEDAEAEEGGSDDEDAGGGGGPPMPTPGGDGDEMLDEMMNLLEHHDDKWSEADSGDAKYEVELPDGDVERAPTKDDVRALLFKNYR